MCIRDSRGAAKPKSRLGRHRSSSASQRIAERRGASHRTHRIASRRSASHRSAAHRGAARPKSR
eukprot:13340224-Alexandrium_andersonii.AAC.1